MSLNTQTTFKQAKMIHFSYYGRFKEEQEEEELEEQEEARKISQAWVNVCVTCNPLLLFIHTFL